MAVTEQTATPTTRTARARFDLMKALFLGAGWLFTLAVNGLAWFWLISVLRDMFATRQELEYAIYAAFGGLILGIAMSIVTLVMNRRS